MTKKKGKFPKNRVSKFMYMKPTEFQILDKDGKPKEDKDDKPKKGKPKKKKKSLSEIISDIKNLNT